MFGGIPIIGSIAKGADEVFGRPGDLINDPGKFLGDAAMGAAPFFAGPLAGMLGTAGAIPGLAASAMSMGGSMLAGQGRTGGAGMGGGANPYGGSGRGGGMGAFGGNNPYTGFDGGGSMFPNGGGGGSMFPNGGGMTGSDMSGFNGGSSPWSGLGTLGAMALGGNGVTSPFGFKMTGGGPYADGGFGNNVRDSANGLYNAGNQLTSGGMGMFPNMQRQAQMVGLPDPSDPNAKMTNNPWQPMGFQQEALNRQNDAVNTGTSSMKSQVMQKLNDAGITDPEHIAAAMSHIDQNGQNQMSQNLGDAQNNAFGNRMNVLNGFNGNYNTMLGHGMSGLQGAGGLYGNAGNNAFNMTRYNNSNMIGTMGMLGSGRLQQMAGNIFGGGGGGGLGGLFGGLFGGRPGGGGGGGGGYQGVGTGEPGMFGNPPGGGNPPGWGDSLSGLPAGTPGMGFGDSLNWNDMNGVGGF